MSTSFLPDQYDAPDTTYFAQPEALSDTYLEEATPLLPAERIDLRTLESYYDLAGAALVGLPARQIAAQVSRHMEVGLSQELPDSAGDTHFTLAAERSYRLVTEQHDAPYLELFETSLLRAFIPAFMLRRRAQEPSAQVMSDAYQLIGAMLDQVAEQDLRENNKSGFEAKLAILGLGARLGRVDTFYYPPTTRESRNAGDNKHFNHSVYAFNKGQKTAVRVYSHDKPVRTIAHKDVLGLSFGGLVWRVLGENQEYPNPDDVLNLLRSEAAGESIDSYAIDFLDRLSEEVHQTITAFSEGTWERG